MPDYFDGTGWTFDECQQLVQQAQQTQQGSTGSVSTNFFTWGTFIMFILALVLPYMVVAFYTGFKFQWKSQDNKK